MAVQLFFLLFLSNVFYFTFSDCSTDPTVCGPSDQYCSDVLQICVCTFADGTINPCEDGFKCKNGTACVNANCPNCEPPTSDGCEADKTCKCGNNPACSTGFTCVAGTCLCGTGTCKVGEFCVNNQCTTSTPATTAGTTTAGNTLSISVSPHSTRNEHFSEFSTPTEKALFSVVLIIKVCDLVNLRSTYIMHF